MDAIFFPFEKIDRVYLDCFIIESEMFLCAISPGGICFNA